MIRCSGGGKRARFKRPAVPTRAHGPRLALTLHAAHVATTPQASTLSAQCAQPCSHRLSFPVWPPRHNCHPLLGGAPRAALQQRQRHRRLQSGGGGGGTQSFGWKCQELGHPALSPPPRVPPCRPLNFSGRWGAGGPRREGHPLPPRRWAGAGGSAGGGARRRSPSACTPPSQPGARRSGPLPTRARSCEPLPDLAGPALGGRRAPSLARRKMALDART